MVHILHNNMETPLTPQQVQSFNQVTGWNTPATPSAVPTGGTRAQQILSLGKNSSTQTASSVAQPKESALDTASDISGVEGLAKGATGAIGAPAIQDSVNKLNDSDTAFLTHAVQIRNQQHNEGKDTSKVDSLISSMLGHTVQTSDVLPEINTTDKQVIGSALQTALTIGTAGLGAGEVKGAEAIADAAPSLAARTTKAVGTGAAIGGAGGGINAYAQGGDAADIAKGGLEGAATGAVLGGASEVAATGISKTLGAARDSIVGTPEEQAARETTAQTTSDEAAKTKKTTQLNAVADAWKAPTTINNNTYNKARAALEQSPESPQFLAEQGLNPADHIENDKFTIGTTGDTADALRSTAGQMSRDTLRPSLEAADHSTPKTPVSTIRTEAIREAQSDKSLTPGIRKTVINNIKKETSAFEEENPDGMGLVNMHDSKITYAKNGGYSPIKSASDNAMATANRHIATALQHSVEDGAEKAGIPAKAFNSYLSKYYKAADYLETLGGHKAPVTNLKKVIRYAAKGAGAIAGHIFGGGVMSEVAGYHIAGALEHALEHLTGASRATFLKNLETTNPEAFTQVQKYLEAANSGNTGTMRLSPPSFIPLGPETKNNALDKSGVVPAEKVKPQFNPRIALPPGNKNTIPGKTIRLGAGYSQEKSVPKPIYKE